MSATRYFSVDASDVYTIGLSSIDQQRQQEKVTQPPARLDLAHVVFDYLSSRAVNTGSSKFQGRFNLTTRMVVSRFSTPSHDGGIFNIMMTAIVMVASTRNDCEGSKLLALSAAPQ